MQTVPEMERAYLKEWFSRGSHGSMEWLRRNSSLRFRPDELQPRCRSIVFVAMNYYQQGTRAPAPSGQATPSGQVAPSGRVTPSGRVARYAWGRDYHKELGGRIRRVARALEAQFPGEQFRAGTDATPLAERFFAERSGIGFTGRNTLLINGSCGSWFVVGEILSTLELRPSGSAGDRHGACPSGCTRCLDVCPTGAITAPYRIDASRCISYLTIEHDGVIPEPLRPLMGEWVFGCDLCQEVCPLNVKAAETTVKRFLKPIAGQWLPLRHILGIRSDDQFRERFAGSPLMRAKRRRLVRNACIAAANAGARELVPDLDRCAEDKDTVIASHARWARSRLENSNE